MSHFVTAVFSKEPQDVEKLLEPFNEVVDETSPYAQFEENDEFDFDETMKKNGRWFNPDARWDWWAIGGRWGDMLTLREGKTGRSYRYTPEDGEQVQQKHGKCDQALVSDCSFDADPEKYKEAERFWEVVVEGKLMEEGEDFFCFLNSKYYTERYRDKATYAQDRAKEIPYAFVASDGSWHAPGTMGWFGIDDASAESRELYRKEWEAQLQAAIRDGLTITIVDCHI